MSGYADGPVCETCGIFLDYESCWECHGAGGYHDCGEDTCPCLYPEDDYWWDCETCGGEGEYLTCPNWASHHSTIAPAPHQGRPGMTALTSTGGAT